MNRKLVKINLYKVELVGFERVGRKIKRKIGDSMNKKLSTITFYKGDMQLAKFIYLATKEKVDLIDVFSRIESITETDIDGSTVVTEICNTEGVMYRYPTEKLKLARFVYKLVSRREQVLPNTSFLYEFVFALDFILSWPIGYLSDCLELNGLNYDGLFEYPKGLDTLDILRDITDKRERNSVSHLLIKKYLSKGLT